MLDLTVAAEVNGRKFDGVDLFIFHPHTDPDASDSDLWKMADLIASKGLSVGSLVAPVWPGTVGGSAFGSDEDRKNFVLAVEKTCRIAKILNEHGVRKPGIIRVDTAGGTEDFAKDPAGNTAKVADTFREAGKVAEQFGERIAAEGEICWGGFHSWKAAVDTLEATAMPGVVGFQADLAHTYLYLLGYNAPEAALLKEGYSDEDFWAAYKTMPTRSALGRSTSTLPKTMAPCTAPALTIKPAAIAARTIRTASSISQNAPPTGCKVPQSAESNTSAGTVACSTTRFLKIRPLGTRSSKR